MNHFASDMLSSAAQRAKGHVHRIVRQVNRFLLVRRWWVVAAIVLFYLAALTPQWQVFPDSGTYLLLAESLSTGQGYAIDGVPHGKYPPGYPLFLAMMNRLGRGDFLSLNIAMCAIALATLGCCYGLARQYTTSRGALLTTLFVAACNPMYLFGFAILSDVPFLLLVLAGLWGMKHGLTRGGLWLEAGAPGAGRKLLGPRAGDSPALVACLGLWLEPRTVSARRVLGGSILLLLGIAATGLWLYQRDRAVQEALHAQSYAAELSVLSVADPLASVGRILGNVYDSSQTLSQFLTSQYLPRFWATLLFGVPVILGAAYALQAPGIARGCRRRLPRRPAGDSSPAGPLLSSAGSDPHPLPRLRHAPADRRPPRPLLSHARGHRRRTLLLVGMNVPKDVRLIYRLHHPDSVELQNRAYFSHGGLSPPALHGSRPVFCQRRIRRAAHVSERAHHIPLGPSLDRLQPAAIFDLIEQKGIDYLIVLDNSVQVSRCHEILRTTLPKRNDFERVLSVNSISIYRRLPKAPQLAARSTASSPEMQPCRQ